MFDISQYFSKPELNTWTELARSSFKTESAALFISHEGLELGLRHKVENNLTFNSFPEEVTLCKDFDIDIFKQWEASQLPWKDFLKTIKTEHIYIGVDQVHNAGASCVQELSFGLSMLSALQEISVKKITFILGVDSQYFTQIAKLRAFRFLLESMQEKFEIPEFEIIATPSLREQTLYDPWSNMLRGTFSLCAALNGGANQVQVKSYDHLGHLFFDYQESSIGRRQAENAFYVLSEESSLGYVQDTGAGSSAIEAMSESFVDLAFKDFLEIEKKGGLFSHLETLSKNISQISKKRELEVETQQKLIAGVNAFALVGESLTQLYGAKMRKIQKNELFPLRRPTERLEGLRFDFEQQDIRIFCVYLCSEELMRPRLKFLIDGLELLGKTVEVIEDMGLISENQKCIVAFCGRDEDYEEKKSMIESVDSSRKLIATQAVEIQNCQNLYKGGQIYDVFQALLAGDRS